MRTKTVKGNPKDLVQLKENARYMKHEEFQRLVQNIREDGCLTSLYIKHSRLSALTVLDNLSLILGNRLTSTYMVFQIFMFLSPSIYAKHPINIPSTTTPHIVLGEPGTITIYVLVKRFPSIKDRLSKTVKADSLLCFM